MKNKITKIYADANPISLSVIEFGNNDTLFVADSEAGKIFAYKLPKEESTTSESYNLEGAGNKIAKLLGVDSLSVRYHDIAVHPTSKKAYVSLSYNKEGKKISSLVCANQKGNFSVIDLASMEVSEKSLSKKPSEKVTFWRKIPAPLLTITDMEFIDGILFVSSLSDGEFGSTLRKIKYPFVEKDEISSIEIYHTVHNQTETRAPIRAMDVIKIDGEDIVIAAYTCTPLVTIPVKDLKDGSHIKGKTIAELGYGNTPLDVINFKAPNEKQQLEDYILVINKQISADLIKVADIAEASKKEGLSKQEMRGKAGVVSRPLPLTGVMQAANQDEQFIATLKRNIRTGDVDLVSFRKGAYLRLNDYISEYNFKDYKYPAEQEMIKNFQNLLKKDTGFPDEVSK